MSNSSTTLKFEIFKDGALLRTETLTQDIIKVGKLPSSHLRLDDPHVSRIHAVIERSAEGEVYIIDLGSAKGTVVNGQKVNKCKLKSGDEVQLGGLTLKITMDEEGGGALAAPAAAPHEASTRADMSATALAAGAMVDLSAGLGFGGPGGFEESTHVGASPLPAAPAPAPALNEVPTRADMSATALAAGVSALQPLPAAPSPSVFETPTTVAVPPKAAPMPTPAPAPKPVAAAPAPAPMPAPKAPAPQPASARPAAPPGRPQAGGVQTQGWYDDKGNWHDGSGGYYDPQGNYYDTEGGWYDTEGYYHDGRGGVYDNEGNYFTEAEFNGEGPPKDLDLYTEHFLEKGYDGSGGGVLEVALLWADHVLAVNQYPKARRVTLGEGKGVDFSIKDEALPEGQLFALLQPEGMDVALNFTEKMKGVIHVDDRKYTLEEAVREGLARQGGYGRGSYQVQLTSRTRARVDIGDSTFLVHFAEREKSIVGVGVAIGLAEVGFFGLSAAMHIIFMFLAFYVPPKSQGFGLDGFDVNNRFVQQIIKPEEEQKEEEEPEWLKGKNEPEEDAAKAKDTEGAAGDRQSDQKDKAMAIKGDASNKEVQLAKDKEVAYNSGALSILNNNQISASWGTGTVTQGFDPITAMGDNKGSTFGNAYGFGAFGTAGTGRGGGGVGESSFGTGGFGTRGRGGGGEGGSGYGRDEGDLSERATRVPQVVPGTPVVTGSLDKELIRRVIRQHRREIKYCYEQELIKNKNLAGKVIVQFTISSTGSVVAAVTESSTLGSPNVERCVTGKVRRWIFPEPKGGGIVVVKYPFVFAPQ